MYSNLRLILFWAYFLIFFLIFVSRVFPYEDSSEKRFNFWPFIVYSKNKINKIERLEIAGPFIYKYSFPKEKGTSLRPIYSSVKGAEGERIFFLSPLGIYKSDKETTSLKLVPLISKTWVKTPEEKQEEKHFDFFPVFWGKTSQNETYGGIFPIYGKFKNRFGKKEITFVLWPIYSKIEYEKYTAYNYLWPFIRTIREKEKHEPSEYSGFKFWPLFGRFKEADTERSFILWPFYIKSYFRGSEGEYSDRLIVFPFYIRENTNIYNKKIVLWPFFQKIYAKDYYYKQLDAPWPFYQKIEGEEIKGLRYWPFYGYVKKEDSLDYFILWPLYFYKEDHIIQKDLKFDEREYKFLIFSKYRYTEQTGNPLEREYRIWPIIYGYESKSNSTTQFYYFPAILPLYDEGMERNYSAFLKLWEYYQHEDYSFFKLLWGLYRYEKTKQKSIQELAFLFRIVKGPDTNYIEFLEGLLGIGKIEGNPKIKIIFMDFTPTNNINKSQNKFSENGK
ncbi:MAG: hypothetical protein C0169_05200 [Thermodesulfobacterium geofontis]|uniref:Uncharacterized protein n=2 Tax=Thermodesulfobacterium geofontis TaxID=1295609 RepID=A0A2N7QB81_9BACT|nr:MAG: hypothetical protein C0169_05200 [Thermodesulfobacterium geofontis]